MTTEEQKHSSAVTIDASNLKVAYGRTIALQTPKLHLKGNIISIIGHNGSGKSTLIKTILELLPTLSGNIQIKWSDGTQSLSLSPEKNMAFSPENGAVFEDILVESYFKLWCRIKHRNVNYYKHDGSHYIEKLNISPLFSKLGRQLSKGERRRVQTAIGFMTNPKLFLFDEPFEGLDVLQSSNLAEIMLEASRSMSLIITSHRMDVVERMSDLVVVLNKGEFFTHGSVEAVRNTLYGNSQLNITQPTLIDAMNYYLHSSKLQLQR